MGKNLMSVELTVPEQAEQLGWQKELALRFKCDAGVEGEGASGVLSQWVSCYKTYYKSGQESRVSH